MMTERANAGRQFGTGFCLGSFVGENQWERAVVSGASDTVVQVVQPDIPVTAATCLLSRNAWGGKRDRNFE